ncbi:class I adenylate-forming enzyme family protein [Novosphingobium mangrovi (ex Huang et al. 2023)]|uniref:Acyl--CoA ligase n=1 Tax=Novosphingobium mangrovi (ex Huang et al. 2023) TaxID=2976432 RepID=A0ABT2I8S6_9SPHN|nr:class I adenylate-forming enzyme family protein [Novosphingobium mangrovi (ex Huang et al. 2023)]MCT2401212.1 acyl--CoA ligase [Novosphingobium mangrovi (ex Huang et al. 2023)]
MSRLLTLHDPAEARGYYEAGLWRRDTLYSLASDHARERGSAIAVSDPYQRLSWAELHERVEQVSAALQAAGLREGDRVSVWMSNRVEAVAVFLACSRNNYVFNTSLHHTYTVAEVVRLLEHVSCSAFFGQIGHGADGKVTDVFTQVRALPSIKAVFALQDRAGDQPLPDGVRPFPDASFASSAEPVDDPDKVVYLAFTSGTTGAAKGVMHSANTLLANARAMVEDWGHDHETVLLTFSQLSHHIGIVALNQVLIGGMELVLHDTAAGIEPIDRIEQSGATYVMGVPTHAMDILSALKRTGRQALGNVKTFYMAGAPIPTETAEHLLALGVKPQNIYGMTENGSHNYTMPCDAANIITSTCGKPCNAYAVKLFDPQNPDVEVPHGEVGEIAGKGAMRMLGYFANQNVTQASINASGWFLSGDLGRLDSQGNLQVVGRQKDMIIRGGHNIHPAGIEDLAMHHAAIERAAAVPVDDERLGEKVCLLVTTIDGQPLSGDIALEHLNASGLSRYDMPEYFAVVPSFPLGPTGKVLKRELVSMLRAGVIDPVPVRWNAKREITSS